jgi:hypothetical protein
MNTIPKKSVSEIYIDALRTLNGWVTVSEWAFQVGKKFPDILEKTEREAKAHKNESTGLREIAARISSNISRGAYVGVIEIDESEKPRKVKLLSEDEKGHYQEKELEDDLAPISRDQKIRAEFDELSVKDKYRIAEFEAIIKQLRQFFNLDFELEHAQALLNPTHPGQHHPDNIQLLLKSHNRSKGKENWNRFNLNEQIEYIKAVIVVQKIISIRIGVEMDEAVIDSILTRLKEIYE